MANQLKPGHFKAKLPGEATFDYAGFADSMAKRIEDELDDLLALDGLHGLKHGPADAEVRDRRRLFVAIARGVVIHLRENQAAFTVPHTGDPVLAVEIATDEG
jgi:hypothetical protein